MKLLRLAGWVVFLVAVLAGLSRVDPGPTSDPAAATVAALRLVALAAAWYLLAATAVAVIAGLTVVDLDPTTDPAETVVAVLRLVALAAAWYLLGATAVALAAGARRVRLVPGVVRWVVVGATLVPAAPAMASVPSPPPVMQPVDDEAPAPAAVAVEPSRTWTVRPGDHLWRVAERTLAETWGRPASDAEVAPYWRQVVEANRSVLSDPGNPDLVFPGQQLTIPEPPAAPYVGRP